MRLANALPVIGPVRVATRSRLHCAIVQLTGSSLMFAICALVVSFSAPTIVWMGTINVAVSSEMGSGGGTGGGVRLGGGASKPQAPTAKTSDRIRGRLDARIRTSLLIFAAASCPNAYGKHYTFSRRC